MGLFGVFFYDGSYDIARLGLWDRLEQSYLCVGRRLYCGGVYNLGGGGARRAFQNSKALQDEAERETTRRLLLAIKAEVETIWYDYQLEVGCRVEALEPGYGLNLVYKLRQQYFTVYESNAQFLGHVEKTISCELRS